MNRDQRRQRLQTLLIEILQSDPTLLTSEAMRLAEAMEEQDEESNLEQMPIAI